MDLNQDQQSDLKKSTICDHHCLDCLNAGRFGEHYNNYLNPRDIQSIFFRAFTAYLVPSSNFSDAREATLRAARELFSAGSVEEQTVRQGWDAVGVR